MSALEAAVLIILLGLPLAIVALIFRSRSRYVTPARSSSSRGRTCATASAVRSASRGRASGRHGKGGLILVSSDPNDARFEVGLAFSAGSICESTVLIGTGGSHSST